MYNRHNSSQAHSCLQNNVGKPHIIQCTPFSNRSNFNTLSTTAGPDSDDDELPHPAVAFCATPAGPPSHPSMIQTAVHHPHVFC